MANSNFLDFVSEVSLDRPVLVGSIGAPVASRRGAGGSERAVFSHSPSWEAKIDAGFDAAAAALSDQVELTNSIHASDPQLVLVFEAIEDSVDLDTSVSRLDAEILRVAEDVTQPDADISLRSTNPKDDFLKSHLYAICLNQQAFDSILQMWKKWKQGIAPPRGYAGLRDLFAHLKDVRPWSPQDRIAAIDWDEYFAGIIENGLHNVELELWFRNTPEKRQAAQDEVTQLVQNAGGSVVASAIIDQIGYHGLKCALPTKLLTDFAKGNYDTAKLVRSSNVMFLRVIGQSLPIVGGETDLEDVNAVLPTGNPVLCLLDGVPAYNHPLLKGRVIVFDPDDLESKALVNDRRHGTWMASAAVWGERPGDSSPAQRPILVRPVLAPSDETLDRIEEFESTALIPDLMRRSFKEIFEGIGEFSAAYPDIMIVNISIGDPASPFETIMSSWARILDWLSYHYGVLIVVSAGNHPVIDISPITQEELIAASSDDRRKTILYAMNNTRAEKRLLAPAESVNALTVGSAHSDASEMKPKGYIHDPTGGAFSVSPISSIGSGYRRSIKPNLVADGGRVVFTESVTPESRIAFNEKNAIGPGIRVATPHESKEVYIAGTSPAAALVSRRAARLYDLVSEITSDSPITRRQTASAIKALLIHGTTKPDATAYEPLGLVDAFGNGLMDRDLSHGCAENEAIILYYGSINANEEIELTFPLPDGLSVRETKKIDATLAWLSPVNWKHQQYRKARLELIKPHGTIPDVGTAIGISNIESSRGATTVQHQSWEFEGAVAAGRGSDFSVKVKCTEQAGGLNGQSVDFAMVLSLWVAPAIGVNVYDQVRAEIKPQVPVRIG